ncbi:MAG: hypothetical protein LBL24_02315 [Bacteroidales bacterium]|jgi:hypothetical protein|nr:hypothetical protein [Bacteroidales bacterium]
MKKYVLLFTIVSALFSFSSCDDADRLKMVSDYPADYDITYGIRLVMQYDEVNVNGIDLAARFPFFETFRLTIHYTDSKISAVTLSNGEIPFSPYDFEIPTGKTACYLDTEALPNELRIAGTNNVIAYFQNGEFSIPFKLDCAALDYKYTFKSVN